VSRELCGIYPTPLPQFNRRTGLLHRQALVVRASAARGGLSRVFSQTRHSYVRYLPRPLDLQVRLPSRQHLVVARLPARDSGRLLAACLLR